MPSTTPEPPIYRVPRHGKDRLRVIRPGESGNPSGHSGCYAEVQRLAREASPEAMRTLVRIMSDEAEETRCRIVAIREILGRAFGKIAAEVRDASGPGLNLEAVSEAKLDLMIKALELAKAAKAAQAQGEGEA